MSKKRNPHTQIKEPEYITRKIERTICNCTEYRNGDAVQELEIGLYGIWADKRRLELYINKNYAPRGAFYEVDNIAWQEFYASMNIDNFVKNADLITDEPLYRTGETLNKGEIRAIDERKHSNPNK